MLPYIILQIMIKIEQRQINDKIKSKAVVHKIGKKGVDE